MILDTYHQTLLTCTCAKTWKRALKMRTFIRIHCVFPCICRPRLKSLEFQIFFSTFHAVCLCRAYPGSWRRGPHWGDATVHAIGISRDLSLWSSLWKSLSIVSAHFSLHGATAYPTAACPLCELEVFSAWTLHASVWPQPIWNFCEASLFQLSSIREHHRCSNMSEHESRTICHCYRSHRKTPVEVCHRETSTSICKGPASLCWFHVERRREFWCARESMWAAAFLEIYFARHAPVRHRCDFAVKSDKFEPSWRPSPRGSWDIACHSTLGQQQLPFRVRVWRLWLPASKCYQWPWPLCLHSVVKWLSHCNTSTKLYATFGERVETEQSIPARRHLASYCNGICKWTLCIASPHGFPCRQGLCPNQIGTADSCSSFLSSLHSPKRSSFQSGLLQFQLYRLISCDSHSFSCALSERAVSQSISLLPLCETFPTLSSPSEEVVCLSGVVSELQVVSAGRSATAWQERWCWWCLLMKK